MNGSFGGLMTAVSAPQEIATAPKPYRRSWSWYWSNARKDPRRAVSVLLSLLRGHWYKRYYRLRGVRFRAGSNFRVIKGLRIRGPGEVIFGDNVEVENATPFTYDVNARIIVGDNVLIGA